MSWIIYNSNNQGALIVVHPATHTCKCLVHPQTHEHLWCIQAHSADIKVQCIRYSGPKKLINVLRVHGPATGVYTQSNKPYKIQAVLQGSISIVILLQVGVQSHSILQGCPQLPGSGAVRQAPHLVLRDTQEGLTKSGEDITNIGCTRALMVVTVPAQNSWEKRQPCYSVIIRACCCQPSHKKKWNNQIPLTRNILMFSVVSLPQKTLRESLLCTLEIEKQCKCSSR